MSSAEQHQAKLVQACLSLLEQHPQGLSEFQLLKRLRTEEWALLPSLDLDDHLGLFQSHFLLFHALYQLQQQLYVEQRGLLSISTLSICIHDYQAGEEALRETDPLRDYYLNLNNLDTTAEADVAELLAAFWTRMRVGEPERVATALEVLELEQAESFTEVKQQYRRLVMQYHPDRGGEAAKMQLLNDALEVLRIHFN